MNEAEKDMKNSAGRGGCYPPRPKTKVDNTLRELCAGVLLTSQKRENILNE